MLPSLRALVFPTAQCSTSSAQNCKRLRSYIQHNCALPDADDLALRAQKFKIADSRCRTSASRAQKPRFCAREARKRGSEGQKRTKTSILCSKCQKTWVPEGKKAQKPRFCARKARKRGPRRAKAHKNPDFVLKKTGIGTGKRNRCLPANHRARFKNTNVS